MTERRFATWRTAEKPSGVVVHFSVSDAISDDPSDSGRAEVAVFPVSALYDVHSQRQRAKAYAEYMNKIADATKTAYEQTMLVDILTK